MFNTCNKGWYFLEYTACSCMYTTEKILAPMTPSYQTYLAPGPIYENSDYTKYYESFLTPRTLADTDQLDNMHKDLERLIIINSKDGTLERKQIKSMLHACAHSQTYFYPLLKTYLKYQIANLVAQSILDFYYNINDSAIKEYTVLIPIETNTSMLYFKLLSFFSFKHPKTNQYNGMISVADRYIIPSHIPDKTQLVFGNERYYFQEGIMSNDLINTFFNTTNNRKIYNPNLSPIINFYDKNLMQLIGKYINTFLLGKIDDISEHARRAYCYSKGEINQIIDAVSTTMPSLSGTQEDPNLTQKNAKDTPIDDLNIIGRRVTLMQMLQKYIDKTTPRAKSYFNASSFLGSLGGQHKAASAKLNAANKLQKLIKLDINPNLTFDPIDIAALNDGELQNLLFHCHVLIHETTYKILRNTALKLPVTVYANGETSPPVESQHR